MCLNDALNSILGVQADWESLPTDKSDFLNNILDGFQVLIFVSSVISSEINGIYVPISCLFSSLSVRSLFKY